MKVVDAILRGRAGPCGICARPELELCRDDVDNDCDGILDEEACR